MRGPRQRRCVWDDDQTKRSVLRDDIVQCVPTKKGHHILYKGYTYVFKGLLQCGSEQWCCSYRQKTVVLTSPDWVSIYFMRNSENEYKCNVCLETVASLDNNLDLFEHIKNKHKEIYELHKDPSDSVGFHIEFLQLNVIKDGDDGDPKNQPVIIGEVCEAQTEEDTKPDIQLSKLQNMEFTMQKKKPRVVQAEHRKRSWVWKYFKKLSNYIFRCELCNVVLSIKGFNTNNMNRHIRSRHPAIYEREVDMKREEMANASIEETKISDYFDKKSLNESTESSPKTQRRSWVWEYFVRVSNTLARCTLCQRNICHGGNATGNMNRHLKMIHLIQQPKNNDETVISEHWVWKVFEDNGDDFYTCKICQFKCTQYSTLQKSIVSILDHLSLEHGVISGDQIITSTEGENEDTL